MISVAGFGPGWLETHRYAQPLFEGFLNEISANGYDVHGASGYSFRCTSGNGGWSCPTGDPDDLSNHAWGLAIDMNAGTNPIRRYDGIGGNTACQTPMQTDMPKWVIETAERWGLYWGGYGWSSGCIAASGSNGCRWSPVMRAGAVIRPADKSACPTCVCLRPTRLGYGMRVSIIREGAGAGSGRGIGADLRSGVE